MTLIIFLVMKVVFIGAFLAFGILLIKGMLAFAGLLGQVAAAAFNTDDNTQVTLHIPVEGGTRGNSVRPAQPQRSSSFFEDAGGLDLEYRGVGVAEDRRAAAVLGSAVPQRAGRRNRRPR